MPRTFVFVEAAVHQDPVAQGSVLAGQCAGLPGEDQADGCAFPDKLGG
ncbi:hypothetical protein AB4305_20705 [Nocardia sp. 2YAB30]